MSAGQIFNGVLNTLRVNNHCCKYINNANVFSIWNKTGIISIKGFLSSLTRLTYIMTPPFFDAMVVFQEKHYFHSIIQEKHYFHSFILKIFLTILNRCDVVYVFFFKKLCLGIKVTVSYPTGQRGFCYSVNKHYCRLPLISRPFALTIFALQKHEKHATLAELENNPHAIKKNINISIRKDRNDSDSTMKFTGSIKRSGSSGFSLKRGNNASIKRPSQGNIKSPTTDSNYAPLGKYQFLPFSPIIPSVHKTVKYTLKILQQTLQDL